MVFDLNEDPDDYEWRYNPGVQIGALNVPSSLPAELWATIFTQAFLLVEKEMWAIMRCWKRSPGFKYDPSIPTYEKVVIGTTMMLEFRATRATELEFWRRQLRIAQGMPPAPVQTWMSAPQVPGPPPPPQGPPGNGAEPSPE